MQFTVVAGFMLASFAACIWACAWLASKEKSGWGWILIVILLIYGSMSISVDTDAVCPKCNNHFVIGK